MIVSAEPALSVLPPPPAERERTASPPVWAVAVLTAPRQKSYLHRTLNGLRLAGWKDVWIFADRDANVPAQERLVSRSTTSLGAYGNHLMTLTGLLHSRQTCKADWLLILEYDAVLSSSQDLFPQGLRVYLEQEVLSPAPVSRLGFISLFTAIGASQGRDPGWHRWPNTPAENVSANGLWFGAQAIIMHRWNAMRYLHSELLATHRESGKGAGTAFADHGLSRWCSFMGLDQWFAVGGAGASFCSHIGERSTLWPGLGVSNFYRGEQAFMDGASLLAQNRLQICQSCEDWDDGPDGKGGVCQVKCRCPDRVRLGNIHEPNRRCPEGRWHNS